ncbi:MAG: hypothetical protein AAGG07_04650 [Planctomycetota bacterium]
MKNMITATALALIAGVAQAQVPNVVGMPMKHAMISLDGTTGAIDVHLDGDTTERIELVRFPGESYDGAASVLDGTFYGDRYGWLADGFITLDPGLGVWVELVDQSAGLRVYEGGMRMMRANHTYAPILGTDGSGGAWQWSGAMTHNWYSVDTLGDYQVTYRVYVGDQQGNAVAGFTSDTVTFSFTAVPAPATAALLGAGLLAGVRRR